MKAVKNPKVGMVIQFPRTCFDQRRSGWNGWLFSAGIIEELYTSKSGKKCAKVRWCNRRAGRYQLLPNEETVRAIETKYLFEYDLEFNVSRIKEFLEFEKNGEPVCWSEDAALLVNHGFVN